MSLFLKVIAGLATGAGNYLTEKAKMDYQAARDEMLFNREMALKKFDHSLDLDKLEAQGDQQRKTASHSARENRITNVQEAGLTRTAQAEADNRRFKQAKELKLVDWNLDRKAEAYREKLGLTRDLFQARISAGEIVQDANGNYKLIDKRTGEVKDTGVTGPVKASAGGDSIDDMLPPAAGGARGGTAKAETKVPEWFHSRYQNATPETASPLFQNGRKIPLEEAWRQYAGQ